MFAYQPPCEGMRLQRLGMPQEKDLVLGCVRPDIAEQLEQGVTSVLRKNSFCDGVKMKTTAEDKADARQPENRTRRKSTVSIVKRLSPVSCAADVAHSCGKRL